LGGTFGTDGYIDGPAEVSLFSNPKGVIVDSLGNVFVADTGNNVVRKITPSGIVSTLAGTGVAGFADGPSSTAQFSAPYAVAIDLAGNVVVTDSGNFRIRSISSAGVVSTLAGSGINGYLDGQGAQAQFGSLTGIAVDRSSGDVLVNDAQQYVRKIAPGGSVSLVAGCGCYTVPGNLDGPASSAQFTNLEGIAVNAAGEVFVGDQFDIRKISNGTVSTFSPNLFFGQKAGGLSFGQGGNLLAVTRFATTSFPSVFSVDPSGVATRLFGGSARVPFLFGTWGIAAKADGDIVIGTYTQIKLIMFGSGTSTTTTTAEITTTTVTEATTTTSTVPSTTTTPVSTTTTTIPSAPGVLTAKIIRLANSSVGESVYSVTLKMSGATSGADYEFAVPSGHVPPDPPNDPQTQRHVERAVSGVVQWQYNVTNPRGIFTARVYVLGANSPLSSVEVK
jgi:hypothetical protein